MGETLTQRRRVEVLRQAIPDYRLPREVLDAEIQRILDLGIALGPLMEVGTEIPLDELRRCHRLLFLGMGAQSARRLGVDGATGPGVMAGIDYLVRRKHGQANGLGRSVVVVGGGNTAIDAARSARRDGADVTLLYRRTQEESVRKIMRWLTRSRRACASNTLRPPVASCATNAA